ncbi:sodium-dependent bicarbonate transport family permease [Ideonella sp.]|uniref:sodium-dependent bicarbonate transport family permease n=1 Tax=Ideonella sp. TaxID=1929293 RepID=UPI0035B2D3D2
MSTGFTPDPAILFFVFGLAAGLMRSNLEIPPAVSRFLSLYLLMALGLKGGFALAHSGWDSSVASALGIAVGLAVAVPAAGFLLLRRWLSAFDAAAVAATYGSVSAVTFITATQHLDDLGLAYGGHLAAAMALMESPAIVMAVLLANWVRRRQPPAPGAPAVPPARMGHVLHEALTDGAQLLLIGSMVVGLVTGPSGEAAMKPFTGDLFKGMLSFFLLDMGLTAARHIGGLRGRSPALVGYAVLAPPVHAALAAALAAAAGLSAGDGALLMVLAASASYIAVPAVVRHAIPEAQPALYLGMSLGITFPLNILVGIPLYTAAAVWVLG